jgi:cell division septum initiation protein DivIVA
VASHPLARLTTAAFACALLAAAGAGTAASQQGGETQPPPGLEQLWREYPLEPKGAELPTPGERPPAVEPEPRPTAQTPQQPRRTDGSGVSTLALVAVALGAVTLLVLAIVALGAARPVLVESVRGGARRRRRPEGGSAMSDVFRRLRRGRHEGATTPREEAEPTEDHSSALLRAFEPYSLERSTPVEPELEQPAAPEGSIEGPSDQRKPASAADLGEHVAAVIATAQQAAEEMRGAAVADAERIRMDAREEANGLVAEATREAERMRADAAVYSRDTRQDADAYAGEKRSEAEAYATSVRAEAEENARHLREAAEQGAKQIEKDARRRREMLIGEAERFEERLHSLHSVFHGITTQLDELLPGQRQSDDEEASRESIEEALRPEASKQA